MDLDGIIACQGSDLIGVQTGAVHHEPSLDAVVLGSNLIAVLDLFDTADLKVALQLRAVVHSVADGSDSQIVGAYDRASGCVQCAQHIVRQVGL